MTAPATDAPFSNKMAPSTHKGWISYQLTGVIHVCEQYGELLARRSQRKAARRAAVRVPG
ncbi:MAG TPA: hypothetical protein VGH69_19590 [Mycobacterium sp.]|jgi:hypothetical protein